MAKPRAFISFDFDNNAGSRTLFVGQAKNSSTPFDIEDWSSKSELPQAEWEKKIKEKIGKCNMLIVLVGTKMATATGVLKEIQMAKDLEVPMFGVYVDGADGNSTLPAGLARSRTVAWSWEKIAAQVDKMMTEGKNADS